MITYRQRMIEDMQLHGYSERTQEAYSRAVRQLVEYAKKNPSQITEDDLRQYFLYTKNVKKWSATAFKIAISGIKFFFTYTLKREWTTLKLAQPQKENKLPVVLTQQEIQRIFSHIRLFRYRACLFTIYSTGLRLNEGTHLQVKDIDSSRMLIHVHRGKGAKDRYVPLPKETLVLLRDFWKTHRNKVWIFPAPGRGGAGMSSADRPISNNSVQDAFRAALKESGINKKARVHTLRHSYATHLLEKGISLRLLQDYLGHSTPVSTARYAHLTQNTLHAAKNSIDNLMDGFFKNEDASHGSNG